MYKSLFYLLLKYNWDGKWSNWAGTEDFEDGFKRFSLLFKKKSTVSSWWFSIPALNERKSEKNWQKGKNQETDFFLTLELSVLRLKETQGYLYLAEVPEF